MNRSHYQRFEHRFYRGLSSNPTASDDVAEVYGERVCDDCGTIHYNYFEAATSKCFACGNKDNPYSVYVSIEVGCEDSKSEQRIREGTQGLNLGLRGVDTVVGRNADGTPKLSYRPITNNELSTARARREYARRTNCTPQEETIKRAVGGR